MRCLQVVADVGKRIDRVGGLFRAIEEGGGCVGVQGSGHGIPTWLNIAHLPYVKPEGTWATKQRDQVRRVEKENQNPFLGFLGCNTHLLTYWVIRNWILQVICAQPPLHGNNPQERALTNVKTRVRSINSHYGSQLHCSAQGLATLQAKLPQPSTDA